MKLVVDNDELDLQHYFENIAVECLPQAYKFPDHTPDDMLVLLLSIEPLEDAA